MPTNIQEYLSYHQHKSAKEREEINKRYAEIEKIIPIIKDILIKHGAKKIILFGSFVEKKLHMESDLDIAEYGVPDRLFFKVYDELCDISKDIRIDLTDINETKGYFRERILQGKVIYNAEK
ncbi:MAG: nucleotidyltransferase domain-containing protein [bacterium]